MRIAFLSDFDLAGSGYQNIATRLCNGLVALGHEVKALGLHYYGQEHNNNFTMIPLNNPREGIAGIYNLQSAWKYDVLIAALDVPWQNLIINEIQNARGLFKYVGIMPIEADPLCTTWAMILLQMDLALIISHFGTEEAQKAGVSSAKYLPVGIDTDFWKEGTAEEREKYRKGLLGVFDNETFVILTVADNQERKNLSASMEAFRDFAKDVPNSKYALVTRRLNPVGWSLDDLAVEYGIQDKMVIIERGMPQEDLWKLYISSDVFLLPSKAEGLGLPLLEAMATKLPCIATDCTGMKELLSDDRGWLIQPTMVHRDCFGNGKRYWIDIPKITESLHRVYSGQKPDIDKAQQFVREMTWAKSVQILHEHLLNLEISNVKEETTEAEPTTAK